MSTYIVLYKTLVEKNESPLPVKENYFSLESLFRKQYEAAFCKNTETKSLTNLVIYFPTLHAISWRSIPSVPRVR